MENFWLMVAGAIVFSVMPVVIGGIVWLIFGRNKEK